MFSCHPGHMLQIAKLDAAKNRVFGFANVAVKRDGAAMTDLQSDQIPVDVLEEASFAYTLKHRGAGEMHVGDVTAVKGQLIESVMITPEKLAAWGLAEDAVAPRWWVGFQLDAPTFAKVASGEYRMFSIQGTALYDEVEVDA